MNRSDSPKKQPKPFGVNGQRVAILPTTPAGDNSASYEQGFPPITMILKSAGGLPPKGQDMNQILYELSALGRWSSTGALNTFDSEFASEISGYPSGAMLISNDGERIFINTTEGNLSDPNSNGAGWKDVFSYLGLGEAAKRDVGTGAGQIPDMSAWSLPNGGVGMPNGINFRYGYVSSTGDKTFSTPFPNQCFGIVFGQTYVGNFWLFSPMFRENSLTKNGFAFIDQSWSGNTGDYLFNATEKVFYIAIGN
ncbi:phage tail protein [Escherichia coli]|uniref:phage tail protein n=1 Tax=Escherichia coli TaxID=562 RepID=UPI0019C535EC|nr:phage tail protein [Escherichia coli]MDA4202027.1 phage tail protein [Escherichia coli]HAM5263672.1 phage tail protein [Escherichia coli]